MVRPLVFDLVAPPARGAAEPEGVLNTGPPAGIYLLGTKAVVGRERLGGRQSWCEQRGGHCEDDRPERPSETHGCRQTSATVAPLIAPCAGQGRQRWLRELDGVARSPRRLSPVRSDA